MIDLIDILTNLRSSLGPIQKLLSGFGYLMGLVMVLASLMKFRKIAGSGHQQSSEHVFVPVTYLALGVGLLFLPTTLSVLSNTVFGSGGVLAYASNNEATVQSVMTFFIQTAGILWFIRGSVLLAHASEPGVKHGSKGLTFIIAGIFALNFQTTFEVLDYTLSHMFSMMKGLKDNIMDW